MKRSDTKFRAINGISLLDKPSGVTSNAALQRVKKLFCARKAGHTGSLDPIASGMLPLCFGAATKFSQFLLESSKSYLVSAKLGIKTSTSDTEGEVIAEREIPHLTMSALDRVIASFRGKIEQLPPMYSALKYRGQPLYKLARQGIQVERKRRKVTIHQLNLLEYRNETIYFYLKCSKGTYVRTLVDDFGELLGCGAHVIALRRLNVGPYQENEMVPLAELEKVFTNDVSASSLEEYVLPIESAFIHWPKVNVTQSMAFYLQRGETIVASQVPTQGWVRLMLKDDCFFGVGEVLQGGKIAPRRLV